MNKKYRKSVDSKATSSPQLKHVPNDGAQADSRGDLNRLYNRVAYLAEGEWNSGDYRSARNEIERIERNRRIKEDGGEW